MSERLPPTFLQRVALSVGSYLVHPGSWAGPHEWSHIEEVCRLLGGQPIEITSRISRGGEATLTLQGFQFSPTDFSQQDLDFEVDTVSKEAREFWKSHLCHPEGVLEELEKLGQPEMDVREVALLFAGNGTPAEATVMQACGYLMRGRHVQLINVRGYNRSEGTPTTEGAHLDVEEMVDYAVKIHGKSGQGVRLIFQGHSLGAHFALWGANYAARKYGDESVAGCLMDRPFSTLATPAATITTALLGNLAQAMFPYNNVPLLKSFAEGCSAPVLIVRGIDDEFMNPKKITTKSHNPHEDHNVEPLVHSLQLGRYQTDSKKELEGLREAYICDVDADHNDHWWLKRASAVERWVEALNASRIR